MTIEQLKALLKDLHSQIQTARANALRLASDEHADVEALTQANGALSALTQRYQAVKAELDAQTGETERQLEHAAADAGALERAASRFHSTGDFLSCVAAASDRTNPRMDERLRDYLNVRSEASGQNITTDTEGGYLVPPDYADGLLNFAASESVMFGEVTRIPVSGNRLIVNILDQESRKDTAVSVKGRNGGLLAYWKGEADELTASRMKFKQDTTEMHKLTGLCYATEEMLEDLPAMSAYIAQGFADEFTFKIEDAILNGTGSGMPTGVLDAANGALVTIAKESGQAAGSLLINNILKMWNAMPAQNRAKAKWYINQDLEIVLYQLLMNTGSLATDGATANFGMPLFVPAGGLASAPNGLLLGRPIVPVEQAGAVGSKGDISLQDLSQYRWIDKSGVNAQTSIHVRFLQDETAFRFTYRCGGKPIWTNAIEAYRGTTARSPFVTLAARA